MKKLTCKILKIEYVVGWEMQGSWDEGKHAENKKGMSKGTSGTVDGVEKDSKTC